LRLLEAAGGKSESQVRFLAVRALRASHQEASRRTTSAWEAQRPVLASSDRLPGVGPSVGSGPARSYISCHLRNSSAEPDDPVPECGGNARVLWHAARRYPDRRLVAAFQRIFGATIFFGTNTQRERTAVVHHARFNFMSEARIWYSRDADQPTLPGGFQNEIVLSHEFFTELMSHPIPTEMEAAKALSCSPGALDLFMWLSYRCFVSK
jgi:hypothetical protein